MLPDDLFLYIDTIDLPKEAPPLAEHAQLMYYHQKLQNIKYFFMQEYVNKTGVVSDKKNLLHHMMEQINRLSYVINGLQNQLSQHIYFQREINTLTEDCLAIYHHSLRLNKLQVKPYLLILRQKITNTLLLIKEPSFFSIQLRSLGQYIDQMMLDKSIDDKTYLSAIYNMFPLVRWLTICANQDTQMASFFLLNTLILREQLQREYTRHTEALSFDLHLINLARQNLNHLTYEILAIQRQLASHSQQTLRNDLVNEQVRKNKTYQWALNSLTPIQIQDIIVTQPPYSYSSESGEIMRPKEEKEKYLFRILQQIKLLADVAQHHHQIYCGEDGQLKIDSQNHITRLITDEFNFYPCEPLTMESYQYLLKHIHHIAKSLPLNIHLILASFPVLDAHQKLHNITVHVASGHEPLIHHHSKSRPSYIDPDYGYPFAQDSLTLSKTQMPKIDFNQPLQLGFGTIVRSITAGGVDFISNIEVCIEHMYHTGALCLDQELSSAHLKQQIIPVQYSHVISSRSISIMEKEPHNIQITQADAEHPGVWLRDTHSQYYFSPQPNQRSDLHVFFGQKCQLRVFNPQPLPFLPGFFFDKATRHNVAVIEEQLTDPGKPFKESA